MDGKVQQRLTSHSHSSFFSSSSLPPLTPFLFVLALTLPNLQALFTHFPDDSGDIVGVETSATTTTAGSGSRVAEASTSDYRVAVFGAGGVGKSSITQRFVKGTFNDNYVPTIEDTYRQVISCNQKNVCTLQITDTTGSHQFPAMQRLSVSKGNAFILIYSVTSKQSMAELAPIIEMLKEVKGAAIMEVPIMLVGNKKDEETKREVSTAAGEKVAGQMGCGFIETSAKNNENITELFQQLLAREKKRQLALTMDDPDGKNGKKKACRIM